MLVRILLFVGLFWLVSRIVRLLIRGANTSRNTFHPRPENNFANGKPAAEVDFKDVPDAEFLDVTEKEKAGE